MSFREEIAADIFNVFINLEEFAESHTITFRGSEPMLVACVVQNVTSKEELSIDKSSDYYPAVFGARKSVFIAASELQEEPVYGQEVRLDGALYTVESCTNEHGVLTIILEANES